MKVWPKKSQKCTNSDYFHCEPSETNKYDKLLLNRA